MLCYATPCSPLLDAQSPDKKHCAQFNPRKSLVQAFDLQTRASVAAQRISLPEPMPIGLSRVSDRDWWIQPWEARPSLSNHKSLLLARPDTTVPPGRPETAVTRDPPALSSNVVSCLDLSPILRPHCLTFFFLHSAGQNPCHAPVRFPDCRS